MRTFFSTAFRGARGIALGVLLTLAMGGAAYAVATTATTSDFSVASSVTTATTSPGGAVGYGINLQATGGFSDNVTLSASGLPTGVTATFGTNPAFVDSSLASASTLWINTNSTTPTGSSTITLTATSSTGATHTASVTLSVVASGSPDYTVELTPTTQYVSAGGSVTYGVRVVPVRGFTGSVVLTAKSVPGAVSLGWNGTTPTTAQNPSVTVPVGGANPGTATLTVATTSTNPPGAYAITVSGTSGSVSHTVAGGLDIDLFSAVGITAAPLYPGAKAQPISVTLTNPYNYAVTVNGLAASVAQDSSGNVLNASGNVVSGCLASWFRFTDTPLSSNNTLSLVAGGTQMLSSSDDPTISMVDAPVKQDACKGVQLKLNFVGTAQH
jgi:hypothetical protein